MKKGLFVAVMISAICVEMSAQTMQDALTFSSNNYYGTARSMALGNAMTAVGGDMGAIGTNPAGSAVFSSSQVSITPGFTIAGSSSSFSQSGYAELGGDAVYRPVGDSFGGPVSSSSSVFRIPNGGAIFRFGLNNDSGLKAFTFGFVVNQTASYLSTCDAVGQNTKSSMLGSLAAQATYNADGYGTVSNPSCLNPLVDFNNNPYFNESSPGRYYNWNVLSGYESFMFGWNDDDDGYVAATQDASTGTSPLNYATRGTLNQTSSVTKSGAKRDLLFNFGGNFNDNLYIGLNIGVPIGYYNMTEYFRETPEDPSKFGFEDYYCGDMGCLTNATYQYNYSSRVSGVYAKIGVIYLPCKGLRLGAAVQSPTQLSVSESFYNTAKTAYNNDGSYESHTGGPSSNGYYSYRLRTPYIIDAGVAYTFADRALLSVDYEFADNSIMQFSSGTVNQFYKTNRLNSIFCGGTHLLRVGFEYRVNPSFSLRAGYNYKVDPQCFYRDSYGNYVDADTYSANFDYYEESGVRLTDKRHLNSPTHVVSLGLGYSSRRSFFSDLCVRMTKFATSYYKPYSSYQMDNTGSITNYSPLVSISANVWDIALTIGWRF